MPFLVPRFWPFLATPFCKGLLGGRRLRITTISGGVLTLAGRRLQPFAARSQKSESLASILGARIEAKGG
jgi:hypothetical protein